MMTPRNRVARGWLVVLCLFSVLRGAWAEPLVLSLSKAQDQIRIEASLGSQHKSYVLRGRAAEIDRRFDRLYAQLEGKKYSKRKLEAELKALGADVYGPVGPWMETCTDIQYVISPSMMKYPLDLLEHQGRFVFLLKPVSFAFSRPAPERFPFSSSLRALIVSDASADPENGCAILKKMLPSSTYYKIDRFSLDKRFGKPDILLVSAHGDIHFDDTDAIGIGEDEARPSQLARIAPRLVYLDSCQLGASRRFVQAFQKAGTEFYLAPIVSNEAGDSSTKTIQYFFGRLQAGDTPSKALFSARKTLYEQFEDDEAFADLMWKAYPFRVYRLKP